jgi:hypothetical protein
VPFVPIGRVLAVLGLAFLSACGATRAGAADADPPPAREPATAGASAFAGACARCHGARGEGRVDAPALTGPTALPEFPRADSVATGFAFQDAQDLEIRQQTHRIGPPIRRPFRTAQDLYDYVGAHVRDERIRSWSPEDSWAVVTLLVAAHGCDVPPEGLRVESAASRPIQRCRPQNR